MRIETAQITYDPHAQGVGWAQGQKTPAQHNHNTGHVLLGAAARSRDSAHVLTPQTFADD